MATRQTVRAGSEHAATEQGPTTPRGIAAPRWLSIVLVVTGAVGLLAAFTLSIERIELLTNPGGDLGCDISPFVSCSGAIESSQGEAFGFPNPFLGLMAYPAVIIMGVLGLARVHLPRWVWTTFVVGVLLGTVFALWLWQQSVFALGLVCPWCFTVYMAMSALFPTLAVWAIGSGAVPAPERVRAVAARWGSWSWVLGLAMAMTIVLVIVIRLPSIPRFLILGY